MTGGDRSCDRAVVCLGHAIVDRLLEVSSEAIEAAGLELGAMVLVDKAAAQALERAFGGWTEVAGGSAANTAVGLARFKSTVFFHGSVGDDTAGRRYVADLETSGVAPLVATSTTGAGTGVCHILVTPSGERSMATHLGAAGELDARLLDEALNPDAIVYVEGYLLDAEAARPSVEAALAAASQGALVALSLSDRFVVERHADELRGIVRGGGAGLLFANEEEVLALSGEADLASALEWLGHTPLEAAFVTRGGLGAVVRTRSEELTIPAVPTAVVDTTGAGDLFAAGALYALSRGEGLWRAVELGSRAASEVISHLGARPLGEVAWLG